MSDYLKPGIYTVSVTLKLREEEVEEGDEVTEMDLVNICRKHGERVDWEVDAR